MRIKSYFAPSVQSAISIARREFGDEVTLVTSHTASLESRHLGDYEVVFAVEEPEPADVKPTATQVIKGAAAAAGAAPALSSAASNGPADGCGVAVLELPEPEPSPFPAFEPFGDVFQQAVATPLSTEENVSEKLGGVETLLVEMGIDGTMVRALMTMIERSASMLTALPALAPVDAAATQLSAEPPEVEETAVPALPSDLTPAELAFYLSVSVGA